MKMDQGPQLMKMRLPIITGMVEKFIHEIEAAVASQVSPSRHILIVS
jgi:hypothetical protein